MSLRHLLLLLLLGLFLAPATVSANLDRHLGHGDHLGHEASADSSEATAEDDAEEKEDEWDINIPHGPSSEVEFEVSEGTWLNVDVHPDGDRLVFDLLGDLWILSLTGGEAERITEGMSWDFQPRWSPDGKSILFTSDRSGGDSLHLCDADGENIRVLTKSGEKDTNSGAWSADGEWVANKRRITDGSPIGNTELWLHHRRGGDGIQLTKKDDLPEVGNSAFSPDGRFLYFTARSARFRYDRNPHQGIFHIRRHDRITGETTPLISRYGGAGQPTLSPDGKQLAYVSREKLDTILVLRDLESGAERILSRNLSPDAQEAFAWTGVYPGMDFTPDGKFLVHWAEGKLWKLNVKDGVRTEIPFRCAVKQTLVDALHVKNADFSPRFTAKVLRWTQQSAASGDIVFSAVGRLYATEKDGSNLRRIPAKDDDRNFEYSPRWSPDGRQLAWVSWNDQEKGQVWVGRADGSRAKKITTIAGQYANPRWSPDGKSIAILKGSGVTRRGGDMGAEDYHEFWLLDAQGKGDPTYICSLPARGSASRMPSGQFSADGTRLFFMQNGKDNVLELHSIRLDGTDRRIRAKLKYGEEFAVSPDGNWLAYKHLHDAYLAPLPPAGSGPLDLNEKDGAVKVISLSEGLADWVDWINNETLSWMEGPEFRRQKLSALLAERGEDDEAPTPDKVMLKVELERARPSGTIVLQGANLITMGEAGVVENGLIVVKENRIVYAGAAGGFEIPNGATVRDVRGHWAMPGLIDAHAHMGYGNLDIFPQRDWRYHANLAYGVTTTMDPSASTHLVFSQAEMVEAGIMDGPRIYSTGFILYGADISGRAPIKSLDDARKHVKRMKALGATAVKSYTQPLRRQRQWVLEAAREENMMVFPEGGGNYEHNLGMILDGHTGVEHSVPVAPLYDDVQQLWAHSKVGYTPTLLVSYGGLSGENWFYQNEPPVFENEKLLRFTPLSVLESRARRLPLMAFEGDWNHQRIAHSAADMQRKGVILNIGAHGQLQGLGAHWEMWAMGSGGNMEPLEMLQTATVNPAWYLGLEDELGKLEAGMLADILLLSRNPLEDIRNSNSVALVMKNGMLYNASTLDHVWPKSKQQGPFPWQ